MAKKQEKEITCTVELTEGAEKRIAKAFVELYYDILNGIHTGPLLEKKEKKETA